LVLDGRGEENMDAFVVLAALAGLTIAIGEVARYLPARSV